MLCGDTGGRQPMSIDLRTRLAKDVRSLSREQMFDAVLPDALSVNGDLADRGFQYLELPSLGLDVEGVSVTLGDASGKLGLYPGTNSAGVVAVLAADALSDLLQDVQSTMGLAMTSRVKITVGSINDWIRWEPVLRALLDGRKVHESGDVELLDSDGNDLNLSETFSVDDDRESMSHFLEQAGFLHLRSVFDESEMAALAADVDEWISRAEP